MSNFILFEGLDRTGKSTISKKVAETIGAHLFHPPPGVLCPYREYFDSLDNETNLAYYLTSNHIVDYQIGEHLSSNNSVCVCDRYYYTTVAYHSVKLNKNIDYILQGMQNKPDKIYYLTANISELKERISVGNLISDRFHDVKYLEKVKKKYEEIFTNIKNVVEVDTTGRSEQEVFGEIADDLKRYGLF